MSFCDSVETLLDRIKDAGERDTVYSDDDEKGELIHTIMKKVAEADGYEIMQIA